MKSRHFTTPCYGSTCRQDRGYKVDDAIRRLPWRVLEDAHGDNAVELSRATTESRVGSHMHYITWQSKLAGTPQPSY